jgi:hypothetical protein
MIIEDGLSICRSTPLRKAHRGVRWPEPILGSWKNTFHRAGLAQSAVDSYLTNGTVWLQGELLMGMGGGIYA